MACEGQSKAVVRFKYPGKDWESLTSYNPPVSYSCSTEGSLTLVKYWDARTPDNFICVAGGRSNYNWIDYRDSSIPLVINSFNANGEEYTVIPELIGKKIRAIWGDRRACDPSNDRLWNPSIQDVSGTRYYTGSGQELPSSYPHQSFKVYEKSEAGFYIEDITGVIYTRTESECPEVNVECGEECPSGSCECVHNGVKCCIDSQTGNVIKVIRL